MRKVILKGKTFLRVKIGEAGSLGGKTTLTVTKIAGKAVFTLYEPTTVLSEVDDYGAREFAESANMSGGPKTIARLFEIALAGKRLATAEVGKTISSGYAGSGDTVELHRVKNRIEFTAPCGQQGYLTVGEAKKLVEGLRSL